MKIIISHPTGNQFVKFATKALLESNILDKYLTGIAVRESSTIVRVIKEFGRRGISKDLHVKTQGNPYRELGRHLFNKIGIPYLTRHEVGYFSVDQVYRQHDIFTSKHLDNQDAVYAYEDGALETFRKAKQLGIKTIYDLPIAYWEHGHALMKEEAKRLPDWANTLGGGIHDSKQKLERKTKELELADVVVVPSTFVYDSLPRWAKEKEIILSPFGSPEISVSDEVILERKKRIDKPLRVLFAGSMGQRKGLGDLFEAIRQVDSKQIELVVMGSLLESMSFYKQKCPDFTYEKGRPHHEVLELMQTCDVFCLPSIVEGRALVMQEAMSQGLPLIITPNTGGEDLVIEGETGFLVPIRQPESIAKKLNWCLANRDQLVEMGVKAKNHASNYTWEKYGETIVSKLYAG
ncbi:MAG: glycosyltransferase family 4 protein [Spirosomataceae bacterium]